MKSSSKQICALEIKHISAPENNTPPLVPPNISLSYHEEGLTQIENDQSQSDQTAKVIDMDVVKTSPSLQGITQQQSVTSPDATPLKETRDIVQSKEEQAKAHLRSLGLSDTVYSSNSDAFYPIITPEENDVDYISFKDIMDRTRSIPLDNLSTNDIELEQAYLKSHRTSSPIHPAPTQTSDNYSTSTELLDTPSNCEKDDPTYGHHWKPKPSMQPHHRLSSARITAQKLINKTKGFKLTPAKKETNIQSANPKQTLTPTQKEKVNPTNPAAQSLSVAEKSKPKQFGLKITHHGLLKHPVEKRVGSVYVTCVVQNLRTALLTSNTTVQPILI